MSIRWMQMLDDLSAPEQAAAHGFAAVQVPLVMLESMSEEQLQTRKASLKSAGLSMDVCTTPLPHEARVTQRGFNIYVWTEYVKKAVRRASELGCSKIAWTEGRARLLPIEGDTSGAKQQVLEFVAMLCDVCADYRMTVLLEPLGSRRTNYLNNLREVADFIPLTGRDNLSSMISLRELAEIDPQGGELEQYSRLIGHIQLENPLASAGKRESPRAADGYDYRPFLRSLRRMGYEGAIALPQDADADSLRFCRELWQQSR